MKRAHWWFLWRTYSTISNCRRRLEYTRSTAVWANNNFGPKWLQPELIYLARAGWRVALASGLDARALWLLDEINTHRAVIPVCIFTPRFQRTIWALSRISAYSWTSQLDNICVHSSAIDCSTHVVFSPKLPSEIVIDMCIWRIFHP